MAFLQEDVTYYVVMWVVTFLAGALRTIRDNEHQRLWDVVPVGAVGGFWGFAVVTICSYYGPSIDSFGWPYLGISAAVGLLGKEQERLLKTAFNKIIYRLIGIKDEVPQNSVQTEDRQ